jgi:hypothetical protein
MPNEQTQIRAPLLALLQQAERDRVTLCDSEAEGQGIYLKLIDSLAACLHNLDHQPAVEDGRE